MAKFRLLKAINLLLTVVIVISVLLVVRDFLSYGVGANRMPEEGKDKQAATVQPVPPLSDYSVVAGNNVFGFPPMEVRPLVGNGPSSAPPAQVDLIGTVSGAMGYVVVVRDSKEEVYRRGQDIPGVGYLAAISRKYAVIKSGGNETKLPLKDVAQVKEAGPRPGGARAGQAPAPQQFAKETSKSSYLVDRSAISEAIDNPARILTQARMLPQIKNGKQEGFVLSEVRPEGVFSQLGLRNGDVLLRINQMDMSGPGAALRAFTALRGLDKVELDILRDGQRQTLTYQIR